MHSKHYTLLLALAVTTPTFSQSGTLDGDFSADGMQYTVVGEYLARGIDVALTPENYIVAAGEGFDSPSDNGIALAKYVPDGELDQTFGTGGKVFLEIGTGYDRCNAMLIQPDGKIVVAGSTQSAGQEQSLLLIRFMPDGTLDPDFAVDGIATHAIDGISLIAYGLALRSDGSIVVAGQHLDGGSGAAFVASFAADGTLDPEFGTDGVALFDLPNGDVAWDVAVDAAGNAVIVGQTFSAGQHELVARFTTAGELDVTFDGDGYLIGTTTGGATNAVLVSGVRIFVGGATGSDLTVAAYNADGTVDGTWGVSGIATLVAPPDLNLEAEDMTFQVDGKLVVCGKAVGDNGDMLIGRFNPDGTADATFGTDGSVINTEASPSGGSYAYGVVVQPDYRIVVAGQAFLNSQDNIFVARYLSGINVGLMEVGTSDRAAMVYPDPVGEATTLRFALTTPEVISCELFDARGRAVRTYFTGANYGPGEQRVELDMGGIAAGQYTLILTGGGMRSAVNLVKQ